ncbi:MAG: tetratricopeptide repeat protein [Saprospiraceae bacterium]|nr:tetratricopeptide repeat protein [Saprospiraceae bacterium]
MKASILSGLRLVSLLLTLTLLGWQCSGSAGEKTAGSGPSGNLFQRYYETYPAPPPVRTGGTDEERETWNRAVANYGNGDYVGAIAAFEEALANERPPDATVNFYIGVSHLELSTPRPKKAVEYFNKVVTEKKGRYYEAARWYRAMCYLMQGEISETRVFLERMKVEEDEFKKEEVLKLLSQLPGQ